MREIEHASSMMSNPEQQPKTGGSLEDSLEKAKLRNLKKNVTSGGADHGATHCLAEGNGEKKPSHFPHAFAFRCIQSIGVECRNF
jgi:hypothetical protein